MATIRGRSWPGSDPAGRGGGTMLPKASRMASAAEACDQDDDEDAEEAVAIPPLADAAGSNRDPGADVGQTQSARWRRRC
mmetsp:Transcript_7609/g.12073  ORF Transcript_7609/g.12073 Transcript_7609/m.12073 type:complete len:80 (+) Transcript_7609:847-1086(+)